jgi:glycosyltransferase involved in cell wall biosynthesis
MFRRYWYCTKMTIRTIVKEKPMVVVAQNPSIVLATLIVLLKNIFSYKTVLDAHNAGIYPMEGKSIVMMWLATWLQRRSDLTIVTNDFLRLVVESNGGRAAVLPDRVLDFPRPKPYPVSGKINLAYICTYSVDEPYRALFEAAGSLDQDILIYVTGNYQGKIDQKEVPGNVKLLGFIPDDDYWALLSSVDFVIDLTLRENCLVCGAYEAVALEKTMILSDTKALRTHFYKGCIYVSPSSNAILNGIREAIAQSDHLAQAVRKLKEEMQISWTKNFEDFKLSVEALYPSPSPALSTGT